MNMHKNARLTPQGRLLLVQRVIERGWTVVSAASAAGLSERQAYRWLARYRTGGTTALVDRSSAPKHGRHQVPDVRVAEIERRRRQRLSGPAIARELSMPISTIGARRSGPTSVVGPGSQARLRRLGLGRLTALEPRPPVVRYQRERPGELVHVDTKKLGRIEAIGHRMTGAALRAAHRGRPWEPAARRDTRRGAGWEAVHVCIDDASRLAYSEVLADERKDSPVRFLERAVAWFARQGVRVERAMTDNGSAYRSRQWSHACDALALRHIRTRPYTPRTNGKAERFIQTSLREWAYARPFATSHERTAALAPWLVHYNHARPHAALAQQPPATRVGQPAFLGSIESAVPPSRPADAHDRSGGAAPGAPQAPGASRRAASLRRPAGPVTLEQEGAPCSFT